MKTITVIATTLSVASAGIPSETLCQSACGLVATGADCRHSGPIGNACSHLEKTTNRSYAFTQAFISPENRLTIAEAGAKVMAPDNNCFAMYHEVAELRIAATYCADNNVCPGLFWDKTQEGVAPQYRLAGQSQEYNGDSAVLCDYEDAEKPHVVEDHGGEVDPCFALCRLSFSRDRCNLVQRESNQCIRLFWADTSKTATVFSVRAAVGTQIPVTVAEAKAKLMAPANNCEDLCRRNPTCAASQNKSNCKRDNRTCQSLVYRRTNDLSTAPAVCHVDERGCSNVDSPVLCQLPEDLVQPTVVPTQQGVSAVVVPTKQGNGVGTVFGGLLLAFAIALM